MSLIQASPGGIRKKKKTPIEKKFRVKKAQRIGMTPFRLFDG